MGLKEQFSKFKMMFTIIMLVKEILSDDQLVAGLRSAIKKLQELAITTETDLDDKILAVLAGFLD